MSLNDRHRPRVEDEEVAALVPLGEEHIPGRHRAAAAEPPESGHLLLVEAWEGTVALGGLRETCGDWWVTPVHGNESIGHIGVPVLLRSLDAHSLFPRPTGTIAR